MGLVFIHIYRQIKMSFATLQNTDGFLHVLHVCPGDNIWTFVTVRHLDCILPHLVSGDVENILCKSVRKCFSSLFLTRPLLQLFDVALRCQGQRPWRHKGFGTRQELVYWCCFFSWCMLNPSKPILLITVLELVSSWPLSLFLHFTCLVSPTSPPVFASDIDLSSPAQLWAQPLSFSTIWLYFLPPSFSPVLFSLSWYPVLCCVCPVSVTI